MALFLDRFVQRSRYSWSGRALAFLGAGLLLGAAGVHFDLYLTGYRNIPTIGTLFLLQVVSAVVLSVAVAVVAGLGLRLLAALVGAAAAAFALGTVAAYGASRVGSVFGFHERPTTAGLVAGLLEVAAFVALGALVLESLGRRVAPEQAAGPARATGDRGSGPARRHGRGRPLALGVASAVLLAVVLVSGIGTSGARSPAGSSAVAPRGSAEPGGSTTLPAHSGSVAHVVISGFAFHPARVGVRPGETIDVTNSDTVTHTMTAVPGSVPLGGFNTGSINPGQTVVIHAPKAPGSYQFYCSIHLFMKGVLVVSG